MTIFQTEIVHMPYHHGINNPDAQQLTDENILTWDFIV